MTSIKYSKAVLKYSEDDVYLDIDASVSPANKGMFRSLFCCSFYLFLFFLFGFFIYLFIIILLFFLFLFYTIPHKINAWWSIYYARIHMGNLRFVSLILHFFYLCVFKEFQLSSSLIISLCLSGCDVSAVYTYDEWRTPRSRNGFYFKHTSSEESLYRYATLQISRAICLFRFSLN